ncbi:K(+)-transporting ATPase subunit C [Synechococcus sp. CS-1325]|uniref:K(+)-transporting ATPase subunit C n=1 Tax=Synechococcus sp. CS-1325 TaxID=2847979 RepID=UPI000DB670B0|nr:K(+)-transporting ATPase subunit C [Synechococcus sp. CS-1325]MCT0199009.1 K(+)-transporting ATPase subunit C [Synechococcus sp. CS-1325]PZV00387.1 MAG: potassium-transporting ATPase subunit C [Cyanobium sp.]
MSVLREAFKALRLTAVLWLLTVVIYTLPLLAVGQGLFPAQANGSLLRNAGGQVLGSSLIGQPFASDRYVWSRPSAVDYSTGKTAPTSAPSNLGPTNPDLVKRIRETAATYAQAGIARPAADLLYASGSGLDPHITPEAARQQIPRLAAARSLPSAQLEQLILRHTQGRVLGLIGEPRVNVLTLNHALDQQRP